MIGGSFTGDTVTVKLSLEVRRPSLTEMVIRVAPNWFAAGVMVTVRFDDVPASTTLAMGTRVKFDEFFVSVSALAAISLSLSVKGIVRVELSSSVLWSLINPIAGAVLMATLGELKNRAEVVLPMVAELAER